MEFMKNNLNTEIFKDYEEFNKRYLELLPEDGLPNYSTTKSGHLPKDAVNRGEAQYIYRNGNAIYIIINRIIDRRYVQTRLIYSAKEIMEIPKEVKVISGTRAYNMLFEGVDVFANKYEPIRRNWWYHIQAINVDFDRTYMNAKHIDINSFFPSVLIEFFPSLRERVELYYSKRKTNPIYKAILVYAIGQLNNVYPELWQNIMQRCIDIMESKIKELHDAGNLVLVTNTDGIWYVGPHYEHSTKLGEFKCDVVANRIRFKSRGSYEYEKINSDNSLEYNPVVRGYTRLDRIKSRDSWEWGDIYQEGAIEVLRFKVNEGFVFMEEEI